MKTISKNRKRKLIECKDLKPPKILKSFDGLENHESYVTFNCIKSEKNDYLDQTLDNKMFVKTYVKDDIFELKKDIKIGFMYCEFCKMNIKDANFKKHLAEHSRTETCNKCLKSFTEIGIQRHSCKIFSCELCGKEYRIRSKFESHLRHHAHFEEREYLTCPICNKRLHRYHVRRHAYTHREKEKCRCGRIVGKDKMPLHLKNHTKYVCDICGKTNISKESHNKHRIAHDRARNPCPECDASFKYLVELARHITKAHRQIEDGKTECPFCKKIFSAISHHLRTHEEDPKQCERCNAVLSNYSAYKAHMRFHGILSNHGCDRVITPRYIKCKPESFHCSLCDKIFLHKHYLIQHLKSHIRFITHPCPSCPMNSSISFVDLMEHTSEHHRMLPKGFISCEICNEVVTNIDEHILIHRPDQYVCEICGVSFPTKREFSKHYNRRHKLRERQRTVLHVFMEKYATPKLNFKKVACLICNQKIRISHMKSHISFHQQFQCIMCQKSFPNQESLKLHESHHEKFSQRCPGCSQHFLSHIRLMAHLKMFHRVAFSTSKACPRCKI